MHTEVNGGMGRVRKAGALVESKCDVAIAQEQGGEAAEFEFLPQAAGEGERDIFLGQLVGEGGSAFCASVAGVDDHEIMSDGWWGRRRGRRRDRRRLRGLRGGRGRWG